MKNYLEQTFYIPPRIEVVEMEVEQGFVASNDDGMKLPDWEII